MQDNTQFKIIAKIKTDFKGKFGIPRQSGLVPEAKGIIVFEKEYRNEEAFRGLEGYSHIWVLWKFSESVREEWSPTVRPPRLGGNKRMGVFATRSPFRPNPIGLSSFKLEKILKHSEYGICLEVSGVDLLDGTPIYDVKPYIAFTDSHPEATGSFADEVFGDKLEVVAPPEIEESLPKEIFAALKGILSNDPRPAYQNDKDRVYSFEFADYNVKFVVNGNILKIESVTPKK